MSDADRLIGRWRLVDYTLSFEEGDSVQPIGARPFGLLIYTPSWMSAHLVAQGWDRSYMSYCGPWRIEGGVIHHDVRSCDWPGVIGKVLKRGIEWDGDTLTLTARGAPHEGRRGIGRLSWVREE